MDEAEHVIEVGFHAIKEYIFLSCSCGWEAAVDVQPRLERLNELADKHLARPTAEPA